MFNSATISGQAGSGYSTGQAMDRLYEIVKTHLPDNIGVEWSGLSYQEKHESGSTALVLGLAFLFVFLVLAALYESWTVPLAVILSLPVAGVGAYLGIWICGLENNIYFQIGLVMLVGLVAKNAILIVEFAKEEADKGMDADEAALKAASMRFRPIVMTSLAFMLGLIPLIIASGPGSAARKDIGTGVFFGMLVAITVGIVFVPFFFVMIDRATKTIKSSVSSKKMHSMKRIIKLAALPLVLCGCGGVKNLQKSDIAMPASYSELMSAPDDTLSIADIRWYEFYSDTTLCNLIERALENNKDFLKAASRVEEARALYGIDKARWYPDITGIVSGDNETTDYNGAGVKSGQEYSLKLSLNWEVNLWGAVSWAKRKGMSNYLATVEEMRAMQMSLVAELAEAYFRLVALDNELIIVNETLRTRSEALEQARLRFEGD